ncbi:tyrosine-type recombinase/integrase [Pseudomonas lalucatii]|uniref:Tyrosine-type recombinase/integrase n=1 Tax=Pseudomonas lalucatii TaxID=1424203 RepID=A0ABS5Q3J9_9PSED|nr:tyrosine-type recombinase/integrase [Pseudomonas lalucatii]MBS7663345.1 tyrosine-type recombinase/integrase [Pseudomonas lalucatii]QVM87061.1 tyrosine-type recombinase/integrase [Pseudomonas lalucatii]
MAIEQLPDGRWRVDVEPIKGKRFRKTVKTKAEAQRFEATKRAAMIQPTNWNPKPKDRRKLSELVQRWYDLHGHSITSGRRRTNTLLLMCQRLGDPLGTKLTGAHLVELRRRELEAGAVPKSINNRFTYLKAVFNELHRLGDIDYPNPLAKVKPLKFQERQLSYLTAKQIPQLLDALDSSRSSCVRLVAEVCLATGARWSEAQGLTRDLIRHQTVTFTNTKSKRLRVIPISQALEQRLTAYLDDHGRFTDCSRAFRIAVAHSGIALPRGQCSHVLRHTFASHFMMSGGNILTLKEILGHASLTMTMRYAHLSPSHLRDALKLNPLDGFDTSSTPATKPKKKNLKNQSGGATKP